MWPRSLPSGDIITAGRWEQSLRFCERLPSASETERTRLESLRGWGEVSLNHGICPCHSVEFNCFLSEIYDLFSDEMKKHSDSIDAAVLDRIRSGKGHRVFSPSDFLDLGTRASVDQALSRNYRAGFIRKIARGLYDAPRNHALLGRLAPDRNTLLDAIARRDAAKIFSTGAQAANALGLSDQVPMRPCYLTTGHSHRIKVGNTDIQLKRAPARYFAVKNHTSGVVIQALRWLGRKNVDADTIAKLRRNLAIVSVSTFFRPSQRRAWITTPLV